ncbi:MAG: hypothetical protein M1827_005030 [Pycnora praestabilis]|nr:MAG: hypothetical protein M1827_005030 [Pycnora praestabilis]
MDRVVTLTNGRLCCRGKLVEDSLSISVETGRFVDRGENVAEIIDLKGAIIAPAFLELQTNGLLGFHFTHYGSSDQYLAQLEKVSKYLVTKGVLGFWATIPSVSSENFKKVRTFCFILSGSIFALDGADVLGAHAEGPYLAPSKKGAHNENVFQIPELVSPASIYGEENLQGSIKLVTLAPELPGANHLISNLTRDYQIAVSLGHSAAEYDVGVEGLQAGATTLTHVFNAMNPLHHRTPGLAGLISSPSAPYYSVIPDGIHLHPATLAMAFRANPEKCILITDSIELGGLPDGVYPGHAQIPHTQRKSNGNKVTIEGTDTLIGSCSTLDECVRNLVRWSGCTLAEAVRCVTENIAMLMGEKDRGILAVGRRADFVMLSDDGGVLQTWKSGTMVFDRE